MLKKMYILTPLLFGSFIIAMEQPIDPIDNQAKSSDDDKTGRILKNLENLLKKNQQPDDSKLSLTQVLQNLSDLRQENPKEAEEIVQAVMEIASIGFISPTPRYTRHPASSVEDKQ
jgi:hypothetical protein